MLTLSLHYNISGYVNRQIEGETQKPGYAIRQITQQDC